MFGLSHRVIPWIVLSTAIFAQEPVDPTFGTTARLVLVPFNVERGKYFAADLQAADFVLREDGHPRPISIFEGPNTAHPLPLELILLFDSTVAPVNSSGPPALYQDSKTSYPFLRNWDESLTAGVLHK
ncbi:MAG: hypothetical protein KGN84_20915, partial [Acidobacteriota bacterium]|nr:hypothetical protein [Acidobacteriota bacterium]